MHELIISNEAWRDIIRIGAYTDGEWSETQADLYIGKLLNRLEHFRAMPHQGHIYSGTSTVTRRLIIEHHMVFYTTTKSEIHILRVLHQSQDPMLHIE